MRTVVLSAPGREEISAATRDGLNRQNPGQPWNFFAASGRGAIVDFWAMLRAQAPYTEDLLALEDDIVTARNFLRYVSRWRSLYMTSFFFMAGGGLMPGRPESPTTFGCSQALWFPRRLVELLATMGPPAGARLQDDALGVRLSELRTSVVYHRSLVQHVEAPSLARPGRGRDWIVAPDFVGEDFDCLTLLGV